MTGLERLALAVQENVGVPLAGRISPGLSFKRIKQRYIAATVNAQEVEVLAEGGEGGAAGAVAGASSAAAGASGGAAAAPVPPANPRPRVAPRAKPLHRRPVSTVAAVYGAAAAAAAAAGDVEQQAW